MARPGIDTDELLAYLRTFQPASVVMVADRFRCSTKHARDRLNALVGAGALARTKREAHPDLRGPGKPANLYCLPDWPGLTASEVQVEQVQPPAPDEIVHLLALGGSYLLTDLCAVFEQPARVLAPLLAQLEAAGRVCRVENEGLTAFALVG